MVRAFVSVPVPVSSGLREASERLRHEYRATVPDMFQTHLTLKFIGDIDARIVRELSESMADGLHGLKRFRFSVEGIGAFPDPRNARVVWAGVKDDGSLKAASDAVTRVLDDMHIDYDRKPFSAHVTIGRLKTPADVRPFVAPFADVRFSESECCEIRLMSSVLDNNGARHSILSAFPLV